jgi:nucleoside phosphorylase
MEGRLQDRPTIVTATGDGANLARLGMEQLLGIRGLEAVIVIGIAGGLSDDLEVGSVVAAQRVFDEAGELPVPDPELLGMAVAPLAEGEGFGGRPRVGELCQSRSGARNTLSRAASRQRQSRRGTATGFQHVSQAGWQL